MKVIIQGLDEYFHMSAAHIVQLFYDDVDIQYQDPPRDRLKDRKALTANDFGTPLNHDLKDQIEITVTMHAASNKIDITAILSSNVSETIYSKESMRYHKTVTNGQTDDIVRDKKIKHVLNRCLLDVLEQHTGIRQPWGILTGVRPTKLMHQRKEQGMSLSEAEQNIHQQYRVALEKADLMSKIVNVQLEALPDLYQLKQEVSIYIGIPYCPTKCAYCTFPAYAIKAGRQGDVDSFLAGLHYEMEETGKWLKQNGISVTTIYFGGGTPTSITAEEMDRLYQVMKDSFPMDKVREITVEAGRPDTITIEKLEVLNKWGIDRISINPQSFTQETLTAIGRHHTVEETIEKFHLARQMGMNNINMDLIIGLPGETLAHFSHTLEQTAQLMPESVTVHTLSFKRASEMTRNKQKYTVASRDEIQKMMRLAERWTNAQQYRPYYLYRQKNILGNLENVGYAKPGQESLYNIIIMEEKQTIIGIGCGAASKFIHPKTGVIKHMANPKEPRAYNERFQEYTAKKLSALEAIYAVTVQ